MPNDLIIPSGYADKHEIGETESGIEITVRTPIPAIFEAIRKAPEVTTFGINNSQRVKSIVAKNFKNKNSKVQFEHSSERYPLDSKNDSVSIEDRDNAPAVSIIQDILALAFDKNASDLHLQPENVGFVCRARINGTLITLLNITDINYRNVVSRIKILASLNTIITNTPQDGSFSFKFGDNEFDLRVSTLPTKGGERVVIRIHSRTSHSSVTTPLRMTSPEVERLINLVDRPKGLVLICGPTGSGKTTTAFNILESEKFSSRNIITIENPIEYTSETSNISQVHLESEESIDISRVLKAILRQDPDVLLFGEIRNQEMANAAITSALMGRLVLSTLHASTPVECLNRITALGGELELFSACLEGIMTQRLVKQLCSKCKCSAPLDANMERLFETFGLRQPDSVVTSSGCNTCSGTGYVSRKAIYDFISIQEYVGSVEALRTLFYSHSSKLESECLKMVSSQSSDFREFSRLFGRSWLSQKMQFNNKIASSFVS